MKSGNKFEKLDKKTWKSISCDFCKYFIVEQVILGYQNLSKFVKIGHSSS